MPGPLVAEPRLTDYIIGTMKLTRREGDYARVRGHVFRGLPYPVRLVLQNVGVARASRRKWWRACIS